MLKKENGVISLEACIVVPIFIFLFLFIYGFIVMFMGQHAINHAMIQSAESLSLDSYALEKIDFEKLDDGGEIAQILYSGIYTQNDCFYTNEKWYSDKSDSLEDVVMARFTGYLTNGSADAETKAEEMLDFVGVKDGLKGFDLSKVEVKDGYLLFTIKYEQEFVFDFDGLASFERELTIKQKMWGT